MNAGYYSAGDDRHDNAPGFRGAAQFLWSRVAADSQSPMRLGVIFKFRVATFAAHALRTGANVHAVCVHYFLQNGAILCTIMQNCMVTDRMKTSE